MKPYYQDSAVTLFLGDCREIVPQLGKFDLLLAPEEWSKKSCNLLKTPCLTIAQKVLVFMR